MHALALGACQRVDRVRPARALLELPDLAKHAGLRVAARPRRSAPCSRCSARSSRPGARAHTQVTAARARRRAVPRTRTSQTRGRACGACGHARRVLPAHGFQIGSLNVS